jgi:hypothetical protein
MCESFAVCSILEDWFCITEVESVYSAIIKTDRCRLYKGLSDSRNDMFRERERERERERD